MPPLSGRTPNTGCNDSNYPLAVTFSDQLGRLNAAITNARAYLKLREEPGSFDKFLWQFTCGKTKRNAWRSLKQLPASTPESDAMSEALRERGFKFVGSTICYAFMQAVGMVNDHRVDCFRYKQVMSRRDG